MASDLEHQAALDQMYFDIFTTACEGGIDFWADVLKYHHVKYDKHDNTVLVEDTLGFFATVRDNEDEESDILTINRATIISGLQMIADGETEIQGKFMDEVKRWLAEPDDADIDATAADIIVQIGLFNELVYG